MVSKEDLINDYYNMTKALAKYDWELLNNKIEHDELVEIMSIKIQRAKEQEKEEEAKKLEEILAKEVKEYQQTREKNREKYEYYTNLVSETKKKLEETGIIPKENVIGKTKRLIKILLKKDNDR